MSVLAIIKCKEHAPKMSQIDSRDLSKVPTRIKCVPECAINVGPYQRNVDKQYDIEDNTFRSRLISDSSVDSEDSFCIAFETGSEADFGDADSYDDSFEESNNDEEESESESAEIAQKVTFNMKPIVHKMIQWDYAYRAARKGPWEEMARDRERFRSRINCIGRILDPILTIQHRTHVWHERFAVEE